MACNMIVHGLGHFLGVTTDVRIYTQSEVDMEHAATNAEKTPTILYNKDGGSAVPVVDQVVVCMVATPVKLSRLFWEHTICL